MSPDAYTIIGTGIALAVLNVALFAWLRGDVQEHGKQLAHLRLLPIDNWRGMWYVAIAIQSFRHSGLTDALSKQGCP